MDDNLKMRPDMTPAEREEVRRARREDEAQRLEKAREYAKTHPLTDDERAALPVIRLEDF